MSDAPSADLPVGYALWSVWGSPRGAAPAELAVTTVLGRIEKRGITVRGIYDVSGLRAGARLLLWLHGPDLAAACMGYTPN